MLLLLDTMIPAQLLPAVYGMATGVACDMGCANELGAFNGSELAVRLFGYPPAAGVREVVSYASAGISVRSALSVRGAVVLTHSGRIGITIGYGRVIEPIGRQYAIVTDPPTRWVNAFDTGKVAYTCGSPI